MVSFSSWNGQKMHGNRYLLTDVLKGELGFQGFVVSDWAGIDQLPGDYASDVADLDQRRHRHGDGAQTATPSSSTRCARLVQAGRVPLARIDDAVRRILRQKFALGLFDKPLADRSLLGQVGSAAHREVAREAVRQSLVLLKNDAASCRSRR